MDQILGWESKSKKFRRKQRVKWENNAKRSGKEVRENIKESRVKI